MRNIFLVFMFLAVVAIVESCTQSVAQANNNNLHITVSDTSLVDKLRLDLDYKNSQIDTLIKKDSCYLRGLKHKVNVKKWKMQ
jgi:hypothetical protein